MGAFANKYIFQVSRVTLQIMWRMSIKTYMDIINSFFCSFNFSPLYTHSGKVKLYFLLVMRLRI